MEVVWTGVFTLAGVALGGWIGFAVAQSQRRWAAFDRASEQLVEALAGINSLLWDYAFMAGSANAVDLSTSRVPPEEVRRSSDRWTVLRPAVTVVAIGDPSSEIRRTAGELVRAVSLFTRAVDRSDRSDAAIRNFAQQSDDCIRLAHDLEKMNLARRGRVGRGGDGSGTDSDLDRLKPDRRFANRT